MAMPVMAQGPVGAVPKHVKIEFEKCAGEGAADNRRRTRRCLFRITRKA